VHIRVVLKGKLRILMYGIKNLSLMPTRVLDLALQMLNLDSPRKLKCSKCHTKWLYDCYCELGAVLNCVGTCRSRDTGRVDVRSGYLEANSVCVL
jgi:hypothetical protein